MEQNPVCTQHFERIDARLHELEQNEAGQAARFAELSVLTARMHEKLSTLEVSLRGLTKALWGISASVLAALFGFLLWYVQSK